VGDSRRQQLEEITVSDSVQQEQARCHAEGYSLVYVAIDDELAGAIELQPTIRPSAREVIRTLREGGKHLYIISGDQEAPTRRLAQELGIDNYLANTLPENKATLVQQLLLCPLGYKKKAVRSASWGTALTTPSPSNKLTSRSPGGERPAWRPTPHGYITVPP